MFLSKSKLGIFYRFRSLFLSFVALASQEALILKNHPRKKKHTKCEFTDSN